MRARSDSLRTRASAPPSEVAVLIAPKLNRLASTSSLPRQPAPHHAWAQSSTTNRSFSRAMSSTGVTSGRAPNKWANTSTFDWAVVACFKDTRST